MSDKIEKIYTINISEEGLKTLIRQIVQEELKSVPYVPVPQPYPVYPTYPPYPGYPPIVYGTSTNTNLLQNNNLTHDTKKDGPVF